MSVIRHTFSFLIITWFRHYARRNPKFRKIFDNRNGPVGWRCFCTDLLAHLVPESSCFYIELDILHWTQDWPGSTHPQEQTELIIFLGHYSGWTLGGKDSFGLLHSLTMQCNLAGCSDGKQKKSLKSLRRYIFFHFVCYIEVLVPMTKNYASKRHQFRSHKSCKDDRMLHMHTSSVMSQQLCGLSKQIYIPVIGTENCYLHFS